MFTGSGTLYLILSIAELIIGMLGNAFIGAVNCLEWVKNRKISLADCIITCLTVSRFCYLLVVLFDSYIIVLSPHPYGLHKSSIFITMFWSVTNYVTTWFATSLSVLYFLKIAHFSHPLFLWLKWRMNRVVIGLLVFSLFMLTSDFLLLDSLPGVLLYVYGIDKSNLTLYSDESKIPDVKKLIFHGLNYLIPFVLTLASLLLLFLSLVRHTRNLELGSIGSGDASTKAHKKAMKMVLSFLFLFIIHLLFMQVSPWLYLASQKSKLIIFFFTLALNIFPSGHPFILILGNSKLQQTASRVLWHLKCHLKRANPLALHTLSRVFSEKVTP
ncbi:LOW QUALITY PROTEIN: taste receptor type 2 member 42 [Callospermophilus lateralis]